MVLGGTLRSMVVSGGLRHGEITGLTTAEMPPGREPEVAYAGVWSQGCWRHARRPSQREVYAVLDTTGRRDRTMLCAAGGTAAGAGVVPLLTRCWAAVVKVAQQLYRTGDVRHDDVCAALGLSDDGGLGSFELALIRTGKVPGTFTVTRAAL